MARCNGARGAGRGAGRGAAGSEWLGAALVAAALLAPACMVEDGQTDLDAEAVSAMLPLEVRGLCAGERCDAVLRGALAFVDRELDGLDGNGRACADCHMVSDQFQLSPASAEARFQRLQARRLRDPDADDPLFRPIDADDFRIGGDDASDFSNLRQNGLIRITFPLPANVKLVDPATGLPSNETFVDVWRAVPSVLNVKRTGADPAPPDWFRPPNPRGGYQLDARFATLQEQALAAFIAHAQIEGAPSPGMLDDLAAFQKVLFSSLGMLVASRAIDEGVTPVPIRIRRSTRWSGAERPCSSARARSATAAWPASVPYRASIDSAAFRPSVLALSTRSSPLAFSSLRARRGWRETRGPTRSPPRPARCFGAPAPTLAARSSAASRADLRRWTTGTRSTCRPPAASAELRPISTTTARRRSRRCWITTRSSSSSSRRRPRPRLCLVRRRSPPTACTTTVRSLQRSGRPCSPTFASSDLGAASVTGWPARCRGRRRRRRRRSALHGCPVP